MGKQKGGFYAVRIGRVPGVYSSWAAAEEQVKGFTGAEHKRFSTEKEAQSYLSLVQDAVRSNSDALKTATPYSKPTFDQRQKMKITQLTSVSENQEYGHRALVVHTDGACPNNGKHGARAGIGVWYGPEDSRNISEVCPGESTNNRAELFAIIRALQEVPRNSVEELIIKTDSKYCIGCFGQWHKTWERNGWKTSKGEPVGNLGMIRLALAMLSLRSMEGGKVEFVHVRGHSGDLGNEGADYLARVGATRAAVDDYDWDTMREAVEKDIRDLQGRQIAATCEGLQVLIEDLWMEEELDGLEANNFA